MKLANAANYFDNDVVYDGYTNVQLFRAQFSSYEGAQPDGSFQRRRVISLNPVLTVPARRVIKVYGDRWVMGVPVEDGWKGRTIRKTAACKLATDYYEVLTPGQAALRTAGSVSVYAYTEYVKDTVNTPTDSDYDPQYLVAFGEKVADGMFLKSADHYLRVRSAYSEPSGFEHVTADEIAYSYGGNFTDGELYGRNCEVNVTFSGTYNPITDSDAAGAATTGILMDMYKMYRYGTQADFKNTPGDMTLIVAKSAVTPLVGRQATIGGIKWQIMGITAWQDAWNLHLRRV